MNNKILKGAGVIAALIGIALLFSGGKVFGGPSGSIVSSSTECGVTPVLAVSDYSGRVRLDVTNNGLGSATLVKASTSTGVTFGNGPTLYPNGGSYSLDNTTGKSPYLGQFYCVTAVGTTSLGYTQE